MFLGLGWGEHPRPYGTETVADVTPFVTRPRPFSGRSDGGTTH